MSDPSQSHNPRPPQLASYGSPAPSSTSNQSPLSPSSAVPHLGPTSRPPPGIGPVQYPNFHPLGPGPRPSGLPQTYYAGGIAPSQQTSLPGYHEISHAPAPYGEHSTLQMNSHMHGQSGQKRAYRQRRKDPSCDACRERKVKCDATDSSSCTECKSRNVNCQFTKETNRRMTSIKQNQDLSKELATAQAEISRLSALLFNGKSTAAAGHHMSDEYLPVPAGHQMPNHDLTHLPVHDKFDLRPIPEEASASERPLKRRKMSGDEKLAKIGANMSHFGLGIFKSPFTESSAGSHASPNKTLPQLPPKDVADRILNQYRYTIHLTVPIVRWKTFQDQYEAVYRDGSLHNVSPAWSAFLFAVFACGTLHRSWSEGRMYQEMSHSLINVWTEDSSLDHVRAALLNAMFLVESNSKSAGSVWVGIAVRICFDLGLNCEVGIWSSIDLELRRRLWWSAYACDCLLALEMGRTPSIKEEDCSVPLPNPVSDDFIDDSNAWLHPTPEMKKTALVPTIRVVGPIARIFRLLKLTTIPQETLHTYDQHFEKILYSFPKHHQLSNPDYVDPVETFHIFYLQNARLILHRHNLQPESSSKARLRAVDDCVLIARSTAALLRKCMQDPPSGNTNTGSEPRSTWEDSARSAASSFGCTHIWRCTLFLLFRLDFDAALTCVKFSRVLGDLRAVNTACGRYLDFFLVELSRKLKQSVDFENDEELLAYVSGDLQGNYESSWVWQDDKEALRRYLPAIEHLGRSIEDMEKYRASDGFEWAGWDQLVRLVEGLAVEQRERREFVAVAHLPTVASSPSPPTATTPRDRLSIKDLL